MRFTFEISQKYFLGAEISSLKVHKAAHCLRLGRAGFDIFFSDKAVGYKFEGIACSDDPTTTPLRRGWIFSIGLKKKLDQIGQVVTEKISPKEDP